MDANTLGAALAIAAAVLAGFLAGGLTIGGGILLALRQVSNSPAVLAAIKALAASFPPEVQAILDQLAKLIDQSIDDPPAGQG